MDKKTFYDVLSEKLRELGVRNDYIEKHIDQFENYFADKSSEQVEAEISRLGDIERVAARIKRMTDKMLLTDTGIPDEPSSTPNHDADKPSEQDQGPDEPDEEEDENEEEIDPAAIEVRQLRSLRNEGGRPQVSDDLFDDEQDKKLSPSAVTEEDSRVSSRVKKTAFDDSQIKNKLTVFRIISILCIPLALLVVLATAAVFAAVFLALAVIVIIAVAILAVVTVAGTCVFVFGMILGIVKLLETLPAGLFECGLSLMAGSAALFAGILVYNFAVRFIPWVASKLLQFMKFVFRKYRVLYAYIKKEVLKL
ncbi:MAG: hypothetical protein IJU75_06590 [Clostridia bacterium]|nr:hypothetical protein [Clostridia bacterium]